MADDQDYIEPPGYSDRLLDARLAGHEWGAVDDFLDRGTAAAQSQGWGMGDIFSYLGLADPDRTQGRLDADALNRVSTDDELTAKLRSAASPIPLTPLEGPSAERLAAYARIDNLPVVEMPPPDFIEPPPSGVDLHDEQVRNSYARSLFDNEVRSPRDFAERYTGSLSAAAGATDAGVATRAAGELASQLPSDRDFTDAAIGIAHSSGVALDAGNIKTVRNNLIDHWADTGQPLMDTYRQAQTDPDFAMSLAAKPEPNPDFLARLVALPIAIGEFWKGAGLGLTSGGEELKAKVESGEIGSLPEALGATVGHLPAGMVEGMWDTAKRAGEALMGGDPLTPEEAVNAAAFGLKFKTFHDPAGAPKLVPQATVLDPEAAAGQAVKAVPGPEAFAPIDPAKPVYKVAAGHEPGEPMAPSIPAPDGFGPPISEAHVRLYRVEGGERPGHGTEYDGRWFTNDWTEAKFYADEAGPEGKIQYVDVPSREAEQFRVSKIPLKEEGAPENPAQFSQRPEREFFLSPELAAARKDIGVVREFDPSATPSQKMEALSRDWGDRPVPNDPDFFEKLAAGQDAATVELAQGYDAGRGIISMARQLGLDIMADESGSGINPFRNPRRAAERAEYVTDRDYARSLIIKGQAQVDQMGAHFNSLADNWKTASGQIENLFAKVNKHMPEWRGELRKGINGDPMNTFMGNMVDYAEGRSMGAAMRHDSSLTGAADGIRAINQEVEGYLKDLHSRGIINSNSYFEDYFVHNFRDPNKSRRAFEVYDQVTGKMGSKGNLMQRSLQIPTLGDGLRLGLELVHENPLEATLLDAMNKIKYGKSMEMLHQAHADNQVHFRAGPLDGEVELKGSRMLKAVPNHPQGMILHGYARSGFATAWNDTFGTAFSRQPGAATGLYEKGLYIKNTATSISLIAPVYHAKTEITEAFAGYLGNTLQMLASGHPILAAEQALKGTVAPVSAILTGRKGWLDYKTLAANPDLRRLVDNGMRVGPRQDIYRLGTAPNLSESWRRGSFGEEFKKELAHIAGDKDDPMAYRVATAPARVPAVIGHEVSRFVNVAGAWLFDVGIPMMKLGINLERMRTFLDANPFATEEQKNAYAKQIVNNTDDRLGEMNMNNVFWPQMVKRAAQLTMLSTTWKYGSIRMTTSAFGYNMERRAFEWNPVATTNLIGFGIAYMMQNAVYQTLMTGQSPWAGNTPFADLIRPRTGGTNPNGTPERSLIPNQSKEFWDWYKIAAFAIHAPSQLPIELVAYGAGAMAPLWRYLVGLTTGKDATGHDIAFQAGGGHEKFAKDTFAPILMNAMEGRKKGTGIPEWQTRMGVRPMNAPAQDWSAFQASQDKGDARRARDAYSRAVQDNKLYEVQRPLPPKPGGGEDARIRAFLNGGSAPPAQRRNSAQDAKIRQFLRQR